MADLAVETNAPISAEDFAMSDYIRSRKTDAMWQPSVSERRLSANTAGRPAARAV